MERVSPTFKCGQASLMAALAAWCAFITKMSPSGVHCDTKVCTPLGSAMPNACAVSIMPCIIDCMSVPRFSPTCTSPSFGAAALLSSCGACIRFIMPSMMAASCKRMFASLIVQTYSSLSPSASTTFLQYAAPSGSSQPPLPITQAGDVKCIIVAIGFTSFARQQSITLR